MSWEGFLTTPATLPVKPVEKPLDWFAVGREGCRTCTVRARDEKHALKIARNHGLCQGRQYSAYRLGFDGYVRDCRMAGMKVEVRT